MTKTATIHAMQKWEYEALTRKTEAYLTRELNDLGQVGWELVSAGQCRDRSGELAWTAFLKRPYVAHTAKPAAEKTTELSASKAEANKRGFDLDGEEFPLQS